MPCSRTKERENPRKDSNPRRKKVTIVGKCKVNTIDVEQRGIGPINVAPPMLVQKVTNT